MKIVIFLCDRYEAQRSRAAGEKRGFNRLGGPFTSILYGPRSRRPCVDYSDSEVLVEEHNEGYCAQQWNRGDVGMHRGCLYRTGAMRRGESLFWHRLDYTGNMSRSGVWEDR